MDKKALTNSRTAKSAGSQSSVPSRQSRAAWLAQKQQESREIDRKMQEYFAKLDLEHTKKTMIEKIISSGQSGTDRAALDAALGANVPHGGWCPKGRKAEGGSICGLYQLRETPREDYLQTTEWNVRDSDGTVIITITSILKGGSKRAAELAKKRDKPWIHLSYNRHGNGAIERLRRFVQENDIEVLNVTGSLGSQERDVWPFASAVMRAFLQPDRTDWLTPKELVESQRKRRDVSDRMRAILVAEHAAGNSPPPFSHPAHENKNRGRLAIKKVISGAQAGADRAALEAALCAGVPHGGWCPKGRKSEAGPIFKEYLLRETPREDYLQRTEWNVRDSDGTVILTIGRTLTGGSKRTAEFAKKYGRPCVHFSYDRHGDRAVKLLNLFVKENGIKVLNVAGSRASQELAIWFFAKAVMLGVLHPQCEELQTPKEMVKSWHRIAKLLGRKRR